MNATLESQNGSSVGERIELAALPKGGTLVVVHAKGLRPGTHYVSLYYDNNQCQLEPYSASDVVGRYTGGDDGTATVMGKADDDLDEINSVSVRLDNTDFTLQACAVVNH